VQVTECVTTRSKQNLRVLHLAFLLIPTEWVWSFYTGLQVYCPDHAVQNANYACTSGGLNFKLNVCKRMCTIQCSLLCSWDNRLANWSKNTCSYVSYCKSGCTWYM